MSLVRKSKCQNWTHDHCADGCFPEKMCITIDFILRNLLRDYSVTVLLVLELPVIFYLEQESNIEDCIAF